MNKCYDIYLGCKDKSNLNLEKSISEIKEKLSNIFVEYKVGFSVTNQLGGYVHQDGTYITENSIKITIIGKFDKKTVEEFFSDLKSFYHQETILVVEKKIDNEYIRDGE